MIRTLLVSLALTSLAVGVNAQDKPNWDPRTYTCADFASAKEKGFGAIVDVTQAGAYMFGMIHAHLDAAGKRATSAEMWAFTKKGLESCISVQEPDTPWANVSFSVAEQFAERY